MGPLVLLILENDDTLLGGKNSVKTPEEDWWISQKNTYKTDVAGRDQNRGTRDTNKTDLPVEREADDGANDKRRRALNDSA